MAQQKSEPENEAEKVIRDYQMVQEQLRGAAIQLDQLQAQKAELGRAKDEVSGSAGKVYLALGTVMVETTKEKALADIKDRSELADVRINSLTKQLSELKAKEKQLGDRINQMYKQSQGGS